MCILKLTANEHNMLTGTCCGLRASVFPLYPWPGSTTNGISHVKRLMGKAWNRGYTPCIHITNSNSITPSGIPWFLHHRIPSLPVLFSEQAAVHWSLHIYTLYWFVNHQNNNCGSIFLPRIIVCGHILPCPPGPTAYECMYVCIYNVRTPTSCIYHAVLVIV